MLGAPGVWQNLASVAAAQGDLGPFLHHSGTPQGGHSHVAAAERAS